MNYLFHEPITDGDGPGYRLTTDVICWARRMVPDWRSEEEYQRLFLTIQCRCEAEPRTTEVTARTGITVAALRCPSCRRLHAIHEHAPPELVAEFAEQETRAWQGTSSS